MLSQKDLLSIQAAVTAERLLYDKFGTYAAQASDPELKQLFSAVQQDEQRHLNMLVDFLHSAGNVQ
ncbi:MAG: ferritin-like domain-containing protein [Thermoanaerobacteraceae bacterium]|nr:ferritin-like domain-containing protein [Thermoanaerobacteraceae bacterium]